MSIYTKIRDYLATRTTPASFAEVRLGAGTDASDTQRALRYLRYRGEVLAEGPYRKLSYTLLAVADAAVRLAYQEADNAKKRAKRAEQRDKLKAKGLYTAPGKYHRRKLEHKPKPSAPITFHAGAEPETVEQWMARTGQRPEVLPMGAASGNLIDMELA